MNKLKKYDEQIGVPIAIISWIWQTILAATAFVCINLLEWQKIKEFMGQTYWFATVLPYAFIIFFKLTGFGQRSISQGSLAKKTPSTPTVK